MPNFDLINQPNYVLKTYDSNSAIDLSTLNMLMGKESGIMLCVRSATGHPNRGGYFFCISQKGDNTYTLETIEGVYVDTFSGDKLITLINHASGRAFDTEMLDYCQNNINFRTD